MARFASSRTISPRLATLALGVIFFHTIVTILEERLFSIEAFTRAAGGAFMTLFMYTCTAIIYLPPALRQRRERGQELRESSSTASHAAALLRVATIYVGTTTLTKTSLRYIDMPTQTVLKSAKLLPVMAGSIVILGKRFTRREWLSAACLCAGIATFNLSTHFPEPRATLAGTSCIVVALVCDALLGPYQKRVLSQGVSISELMCAQVRHCVPRAPEPRETAGGFGGLRVASEVFGWLRRSSGGFGGLPNAERPLGRPLLPHKTLGRPLLCPLLLQS